MRVALSCRYPHVEVLLSRNTTISEFIDRLTQYWQLNHHAQSVSSFIVQTRRQFMWGYFDPLVVWFSYSKMICRWSKWWCILMARICLHHRRSLYRSRLPYSIFLRESNQRATQTSNLVRDLIPNIPLTRWSILQRSQQQHCRVNAIICQKVNYPTNQQHLLPRWFLRLRLRLRLPFLHLPRRRRPRQRTTTTTNRTWHEQPFYSLLNELLVIATIHRRITTMARRSTSSTGPRTNPTVAQAFSSNVSRWSISPMR